MILTTNENLNLCQIARLRFFVLLSHWDKKRCWYQYRQSCSTLLLSPFTTKIYHRWFFSAAMESIQKKQRESDQEKKRNLPTTAQWQCQSRSERECHNRNRVWERNHTRGKESNFKRGRQATNKSLILKLQLNLKTQLNPSWTRINLVYPK